MIRRPPRRSSRRSTTVATRHRCWSPSPCPPDRRSPATRTRWPRPSTRSSRACRPDDDRTAYAMVFYPFPATFDAELPTEPIRHAAEGAVPSGATVGVTGMDALAVGSDTGGPGVLTETLIGAFGAFL